MTARLIFSKYIPRIKGAGAGVTATQPNAAILSDMADRWLNSSDLLFFSLYKKINRLIWFGFKR